MDWVALIREATVSSFSTILQITLIVVPLLIITEFLKVSGWLDKITKGFSPLTKKLDLPKEASFPIVVALAIGLQYGAGVVMQVGKEGVLSTRDLTVTCVFIAITHGLIEETILFASVGGNGFILLGSRVLAGIIFTYLFLLHLKLSEKLANRKKAHTHS